MRETRGRCRGLIIYAGEPEQYFTFITPEAYNALEEWMEFRKRAGENVTKDSWLMRNLWDCRGATTGKGVATIPSKLAVNGLSALTQNAIRTQGLRTKLEPGKRRYEIRAHQGFRKYFKTHAEHAGMKPIHVEILMGHSTGISDSYYTPTEKDLLEDYLKAVMLLTIEGRAIPMDTQSIEKEIDDLVTYVDSGRTKKPIAVVFRSEYQRNGGAEKRK